MTSFLDMAMLVASNAALKYCDLYVTSSAPDDDLRFLRDIYIPAWREMMQDEQKLRVPIHFRFGRYKNLKGNLAEKFRLLVVVDTPANEPSASLDVRDKSQPRKWRQNEVLRQANCLQRTVWVITHPSGTANVFVMDQQFAFRVMTYAYGLALRRGIPLPTQIQAQFDVNHLHMAQPWLQAKAMSKRMMPGFLVNRLLCADRLAHLAAWQQTKNKPASEVKEVPEALRYWASRFGAGLVPTNEDTSHNGDDMSEFGINSIANSAENSKEGAVPASDDGQHQPLASEWSALNDELLRDDRRSSLCTHEFRDRLFGAAVVQKLAERAGRALAAAEQLMMSISQQTFNQNWTQIDVFYLFQLMALECSPGRERVSRVLSEQQTIAHTLAQCSPALITAIERVSRLLYVFLVDRKRRLQAPQRNAAMVACALWYSNETYARVRDCFDTLDYGQMLDALQTRGTVRQRRNDMTLVALAGAPLHGQEARTSLEEFMRTYVLVADELAAPRVAVDVLVRVPINDAVVRPHTYQSTEESYMMRALSNSGMTRAERATPMSVLSSIRNACPDARDGIDFLVVWTPLSYHMSNDERYQRAYGAHKSRSQDIYMGDDEADYAVKAEKHVEVEEEEEKEEEVDDDDDDDEDFRNTRQILRPKRYKSRPVKRRVRKAVGARPSVPKVGRRAQEPPMPLAEPTIYVAMSQRVWETLEATRFSTLLLQRAQHCVAPHASLRNFDAPLAAPFVVDQLSNSTNIEVLCGALNALSALIGASATEWQPGTRRATLYAQQAARLAIDYLEMLSVRRAPLSVASLIGALHKSQEEMDAISGERRAIRRIGGDKKNYAARDRPHADKSNAYSALAIILNGCALPVLVNEPYCRFLHDVCAGDARLEAHLDQCERECAANEERWGNIPEWYTRMLNTNPNYARIRDNRRYRKLGLPEVHSSDEEDDDDDEETKGRAKREHEQQEAADRALYERVRQLARTRNVDVQSYCACGGASIEECTTLMRAVYKKANANDDDDEEGSWDFGASTNAAPCCCLCTLDTLPAPKNPSRLTRFMAGVCKWCLQRVEWYIDGADRGAELYTMQIHVPGRAVTSLDVIGAVLRWALVDPDRRYIHTVACLDSMRFRLRNWVSVGITPRAWQWNKQPPPPLAFSLDRTQPLTERVETLGNYHFRVPLRATLELAGPYLGTEPDDNLDEETDAFVARWRRTTFATYAVGALELMALARHSDFVQHFEPNWPETVAANNALLAMTDLLVPLRTPRQLYRYCKRVRERRPVFPLCASALAESTAHGAVALSTMASNTVLPIHERLQHILYNQQSVRPLAGAMPLLQELMMMRWYEDAHVQPAAPPPADVDSDEETKEEKSLRSRH